MQMGRPQIEQIYDGSSPRGEVSAWLWSLAAHLSLLIAFSLITTTTLRSVDNIQIVALPDESAKIEVAPPPELAFSALPTEAIGADGVSGIENAFSEADVLNDLSQVEQPEIEVFEVGQFDVPSVVEISTGINYSEQRVTKGTAGFATKSALGAIDRITEEIRLSMEDRKTLVVWLFDQSASLHRQRAEILDRFDRIYRELGVVQERYRTKPDESPLLTSVVAFGESVTFPLADPSSNVDEIKHAVRQIPQDDSGVELVFNAIQHAIGRYRRYRDTDPSTREPERNVMLIVFTD
ncbi:MAG: VWA domain-containing protein [Planctomycetales bacterium]|nr:VWA domain-containing protein [Planctomycetales bacterium]